MCPNHKKHETAGSEITISLHAGTSLDSASLRSDSLRVVLAPLVKARGFG
jgi:hypothetical protein